MHALRWSFHWSIVRSRILLDFSPCFSQTMLQLSVSLTDFCKTHSFITDCLCWGLQVQWSSVGSWHWQRIDTVNICYDVLAGAHQWCWPVVCCFTRPQLLLLLQLLLQLMIVMIQKFSSSSLWLQNRRRNYSSMFLSLCSNFWFSIFFV